MYNYQIDTLSLPLPDMMLRDERRWEGPARWPESFQLAMEMGAPEARVINADVQLLKRIIAIVKTNMADENFGVSQLAKETGLCRRQLHRKLRSLVNLSPSHFIRTLRLQRAALMIRQNADTVAGIAYQTGFNTPNYFCTVFRKTFGCTPKVYRDKMLSELKFKAI